MRPFPSSRAALCGLTFSLLSPVAVAQATWVVDHHGGGDFKTLPDAANSSSVSDNDLILVKLAAYTGGGVWTKGVRVVCEPGVTIEGVIEVKQLEAGKQLVWSGGAHRPSGTLRLHAYGIKGRVLIDEIRLDGRQTLPGLLWESSGGYLSVNGSKLSGAPAVDLRYPSEVVLSGCSVTTHANVLTTPTPGVSAYQTTLTVAQCQIQGPGSYVQSGAGIRFSQYPSFWGEVRVSGDSSSWIVGGGFSPQVAIEMAGGILRRDSRVLLYGSIGLTSGATQSVGSIPSQRVLGAGIGGTIQADAVHSSSGVVLMYMGLPAPQPLPVFAYPSPLFHIDTATMILLTSAAYKEKVSVPIGVPNNASLRGLVLTFQTLAGSRSHLPEAVLDAVQSGDDRHPLSCSVDAARAPRLRSPQRSPSASNAASYGPNTRCPNTT